VREQWGPLRRVEHAKVTENAEIHGSRIHAIDPASSLEATLDLALLEDARRNHYKELIADWEAFKAGWTDHARKCEEWVVAMATRILNDSQLPAHPAPQGPYVMQSSLAIFLYLRMFERPSSTLQKVKQDRTWHLEGVGNLASGSEEQIDGLLSLLERLKETEQGTVKMLRNQSRVLQGRLWSLVQKLSLAAVERSLRERCSMVTFFR
jgi:hypothetical protein